MKDEAGQVKAVAKNLDEPAKILGLTPFELASCAIVYAILSPILKGVLFQRSFLWESLLGWLWFC